MVVGAGSAPGLRIVLAQGTDGTGMGDLLRPAAERIVEADAGAGQVESLDYPGTGTVRSTQWPGWVQLGTSPRVGVRRLVTLLEEHAVERPDVGVVLLGYSQGALVITETLSPAEDRRYAPRVPALSEPAVAVVRAAVGVANPAFGAGEPFNAGTPTPGVSGMWPRPPGVLARVADRVVDFAEHDDIAAQHVPGSSLAGHVGYPARGYVERIVHEVLRRVP